MDVVNIVKGGVRTSTDMATFERMYKPNGWAIDEVVNMRTQEQVASYNKMLRHEQKHFDDKLFYSDGG